MDRPQRSQKAAIASRVLLILLVLATLVEAGSLVRRGSRGSSDFGVYYRTVGLVNEGVGADLYPRLDEATGWPVVIAPAGLVFVWPLAPLSLVGASVAWALFNLALMAASIYGLRVLVDRLASPRLQARFAWVAMAFLVLAAGSLQVGQYSVLFVACWIAALCGFTAGRLTWPGALLALPAVIKIYPALLMAAPLSALRISRLRGVVGGFVIGAVVATLFVPALLFGSRIVAVNVSFAQNVPLNQVRFQQSLRTIANQSLDTVLLRYLTDDPEFHPLHPAVPHLGLSRDVVLQIANVCRAAILLVTCLVVLRWRRRRRESLARDMVSMAALWLATLYVILPEAKSRYSIYVVIAFLPLIESANSRVALLGTAACVLLITVLLPAPLQVAGVGLCGPLALWVANLRLCSAPRLER